MSSTEVRASIAGIGSCHASHRAAIVRFNALPHRAVRRERHRVDPRRAVHGFEHASLRERHAHRVLSNDGVYAVRADQKRRVDRGAVGRRHGHAADAAASGDLLLAPLFEALELAPPPHRAGGDRGQDALAQPLPRDVHEPPAVLALLATTTTLAGARREGFAVEVQDAAARVERVVRRRRRVVGRHVDSQRPDRVEALDREPVPLLPSVERRVALEDEHFEALALKRDRDRGAADAAAGDDDHAALFNLRSFRSFLLRLLSFVVVVAVVVVVVVRAAAAAAAAILLLPGFQPLQLLRDPVLPRARERPLRVVQLLVVEVVRESLRASRERGEQPTVDAPRVRERPRDVRELLRAEVVRSRRRGSRERGEQRREGG
eukprot:11278-Pelagococcus_subviridis.AAC.3